MSARLVLERMLSLYAHTITMAGAVKDPLVVCFYPGTARFRCNRDYNSLPPKSFGVHIPLEIKSKPRNTTEINPIYILVLLNLPCFALCSSRTSLAFLWENAKLLFFFL